ncbi:hypothetical protein U1Q18_044996 [Sarracenia purpurea var. burkii]
MPVWPVAMRKRFQKPTIERRSSNRSGTASTALESLGEDETNRKSNSGEGFSVPTTVSSSETGPTWNMARAIQKENQKERKSITDGKINAEERKGEILSRKGNEGEKSSKSSFGKMENPKPYMVSADNENYLLLQTEMGAVCKTYSIKEAEPNTCMGFVSPVNSRPKDPISRIDPKKGSFCITRTKPVGMREIAELLGLRTGNVEQEKLMGPQPSHREKTTLGRRKKMTRAE